MNYNVSKNNFWVKKLTINEWTIQNAFTCIGNFKDIPSAKDYVLASFDVSYLIHKCPTRWNLISYYGFSFRYKQEIQGLNKVSFEKLLAIATTDILSYFSGKLYKEIEGVAMGSPLGPTLACIFMCYFDMFWLKECLTSFKFCHYFVM